MQPHELCALRFRVLELSEILLLLPLLHRAIVLSLFAAALPRKREPQLLHVEVVEQKHVQRLPPVDDLDRDRMHPSPLAHHRAHRAQQPHEVKQLSPQRILRQRHHIEHRRPRPSVAARHKKRQIRSLHDYSRSRRVCCCCCCCCYRFDVVRSQRSVLRSHRGYRAWQLRAQFLRFVVVAVFGGDISLSVAAERPEQLHCR
mmetsp:Transcript_15251/g.40940  ORF Transcript_15251/g.40940 Transcript_15251/m.40940 type:complete len:201 (+) Transcript_15251:1562-2164(+)